MKINYNQLNIWDKIIIMGFLTTHVLDTSNGRPASDVQIELQKVLESKTIHITKVFTNEDGRCSEPILEGENFVVGTYELNFYIGEYFKSRDPDMRINNFLGIVPVRFNISSSEEHYHVPLLVSPFSYSTYRGS